MLLSPLCRYECVAPLLVHLVCGAVATRPAPSADPRVEALRGVVAALGNRAAPAGCHRLRLYNVHGGAVVRFL